MLRQVLVCLSLLLVPQLAAALELTGDELYDSYSALVRARIEPLRLGTTSALPAFSPAVVPREQIEALERQFGSDSRFWELKAWCVELSDSPPLPEGYATDNGWITGSPSAQRIEYLRRARECGNASPFALYRLATLESNERWRSLEEDQTVPAGEGPEYKAWMAKFSRKDEQHWQADLDAIIASWPDEAWAYYWKAQYQFSLGEQEDALRLLALGNQAPDCRACLLFPESFVRQRIWDGGDYGDELVAGAVISLWQLNTNYIKWKERAKELEMSMALSAGSTSVNELQQFACRIGCSEACSLFDSANCLGLIRSLGSSELICFGEDLSLEQLRTLFEQQNISSRMLKTIATLLAAQTAANGWDTTTSFSNVFGDTSFYSPDDQGTQLRWTMRVFFPLIDYSAYVENLIGQNKAIKEALAPGFAELRQVDHATLAWPADWYPSN